MGIDHAYLGDNECMAIDLSYASDFFSLKTKQKLWWHTSAITCQIIMLTCQIFMSTCQIMMLTCQLKNKSLKRVIAYSGIFLSSLVRYLCRRIRSLCLLVRSLC